MLREDLPSATRRMNQRDVEGYANVNERMNQRKPKDMPM
jgi:hypothetical protein